jgi:hypothetical protein
LPQGRSAPNKGDTKEVIEALKADLANEGKATTFIGFWIFCASVLPLYYSVRQQILTSQLAEFCKCYSLKTHPFSVKSISFCLRCYGRISINVLLVFENILVPKILRKN